MSLVPCIAPCFECARCASTNNQPESVTTKRQGWPAAACAHWVFATESDSPIQLYWYGVRGAAAYCSSGARSSVA